MFTGKKHPRLWSRRSAGQTPHGTCFGRGATRGRSTDHWRIASAFLTVAVSVCVTARAQTFHFVEVQSARGIGNYYMSNGFGAGVAAADFDSDGDIDMFVPNAAGIPDQLYRNLGDGHYENIAAAAGLDSLAANRCALWFDYDGDHDLDLVVANDLADAPTLRLYRQTTEAVFEDVTDESGLFAPLSPVNSGEHRGGLCAGDLTHNGYLDLFVPKWRGESHLFFNNGDGTFSDVSESSGIREGMFWDHQCMMYDFDQDGWLDVYVAEDFGPNHLWINQHDGTFVDMAPAAGADNSMNDMGLTLGDYDRDGDFDIYMTNICGVDDPDLLGYNVLLRNDSTPGQLQFVDVSPSLGVGCAGWGWGTTFMDGDGDGWIDIAATNGFLISDRVPVDASKFYLNLGGDPTTFVEESADVLFNDTYWGSALIAFDSDRDGDLDLVQVCADGPLRLLENRQEKGSGGNYLVVKPRMPGPNHFAIGAVVRITVNGQQMMRLITAGTSYLGQEPAEAFFGLGTSNFVERLEINWPDGTVSVLWSIDSNQVLTVDQATAGIVPTIGEWGAIAMAIVLLVAGTRVIRRRVEFQARV
ncbi:MAG: VCBS repeat-containing protein [Planctomycetes bacterium]|nr:VCBS repeat-containing protein [Planctomycetota bacterium]